jgi:hypothetical protein
VAAAITTGAFATSFLLQVIDNNVTALTANATTLASIETLLRLVNITSTQTTRTTTTISTTTIGAATTQPPSFSPSPSPSASASASPSPSTSPSPSPSPSTPSSSTTSSSSSSNRAGNTYMALFALCILFPICAYCVYYLWRFTKG